MSMNYFKASYIINKCEMQFLLNSTLNSDAKITASRPAQYILDHYLIGGYSPDDAAASLIYKMLAKKVSGAVVLEPVLSLLVKSVLTSDTLWLAENGNKGETTFFLKSNKLFLLAKKYAYIPHTWTITPYKGIEPLTEDLRGVAFSRITQIDKHGTAQSIPDGGDVQTSIPFALFSERMGGTGIENIR